jgi:fatty-acyl-CoA synthase
LNPAQQSYARGPEEPFCELSIGDLVRQTAQRFPRRDAVIIRHQNVRLTWEELDNRVDRTVRGLKAMGLEPGDRVGVWATNCVEWILLQHACGRAGLVLVNVNPAYRSHELRYVLETSRMKALFLRERDARADYAAIFAESRTSAQTGLEHVYYIGGDWIDGPKVDPVPVSASAVANIQYTSGTTGSPKGVLLTHRNLVNNARGIASCLKATEQDRICAPVPLYHCFGCVIGTLVSAATGAALIVPSAQFDTAATLEAVHDERATALYGVPTMFIAELEHPEFSKFDLTSLRTGVMAGAPCPIETMKQVVSQMHCREITIAYGQTESSPVITMSRTSDSIEHRVNTVGAPLPNTEVKIVSPTSGETLPVGVQGELCVRGYLVMRGYDGRPEETAAAIDADGWLHTGDLALMQADGYFRIKGRARDTIIRGGENIYPREVEEFLHTFPAISDVYVFAIPDVRLGETVSAWVRLKAGHTASEAEIQDWCRGKIAYFKIPQYIRFVDSFPMTVTGKIRKYLMRETEVRERGLEAAARMETA